MISVLPGPSPSGPPAEAFPPMTSHSVTLCPTDHLSLHFQAQPVPDLPDLADVRERVLMADEVPVDDHDGGWRERTAVLA